MCSGKCLVSLGSRYNRSRVTEPRLPVPVHLSCLRHMDSADRKGPAPGVLVRRRYLVLLEEATPERPRKSSLANSYSIYSYWDLLCAGGGGLGL